MKFTREIRVPASKYVVFAKLNDTRLFASCAESVNDLNEMTPTHYTATLETRIAYIKFRFAVSVEIIKVNEPDEIVGKGEGTPMGVVGRLTATSSATLREEGIEIVVAYDIDVSLTGKLGSIGQPALKSKAGDMEKQFAQNLRAAFTPTGATA